MRSSSCSVGRRSATRGSAVGFLLPMELALQDGVTINYKKARVNIPAVTLPCVRYQYRSKSVTVSQHSSARPSQSRAQSNHHNEG
jgi:hypothetical protein